MIVALANVEATIDITQLRSLHIPLERQFKADLYASATLVADSKVVHRLGVALVSLLTIAISFVTFLGHNLFQILIIPYQHLLYLANVHCMEIALGIVLVDGFLIKESAFLKFRLI